MKFKFKRTSKVKVVQLYLCYILFFLPLGGGSQAKAEGPKTAKPPEDTSKPKDVPKPAVSPKPSEPPKQTDPPKPTDPKPTKEIPKTSTTAPPAEAAKAEQKDHVIQIDEPESPTKNLYITKEEDSALQKPLTPTPSVHSKSEKSEQILSASKLEADHGASTSDKKPESEPKEEKKPKDPKPPKPKPGPSPAPAPAAPQMVTDKGKSKVTGKM
ncbi:unnamed protein product, partial [Leptidea sinapis]